MESQQRMKYWNCSVAAVVVGAWYRQDISCHGACDATSRMCFAATCRVRLLSSREVSEDGCICRALPIMSLSVTCLIVAAVCSSGDCGNVVADCGVEMPSLFWFVHVTPSASVVCRWSLWVFYGWKPAISTVEYCIECLLVNCTAAYCCCCCKSANFSGEMLLNSPFLWRCSVLGWVSKTEALGAIGADFLTGCTPQLVSKHQCHTCCEMSSKHCLHPIASPFLWSPKDSHHWN